MANESQVHHGTVRGKLIELDDETGLPAGQPVTIILRPQSPPHLPGDGIRHSAGGWADDPAGLDEYLAWNRKQRKASRQGTDA
jgi:hypothetical protein